MNGIFSLCLLLAAFVNQFTSATIYQAEPTSPDEAAIRMFITNYYDLWQKKDVAGLEALWDASAPYKFEIKPLPSVDYNFSNLKIVKVQIQDSRAVARVDFDKTVRPADLGNGRINVSAIHSFRKLSFVKRNGEWKLWQDDSAAAALAAEVVNAKTDEAQRKLLEENSELASIELRNEFISYGGTFLGNGEKDRAIKAYQIAIDIGTKIGREKDLGHSIFMIGFIQQMQGKPAEALENFQKAIKLFNDVGNISSLAITQYNIANVYYQQGQYDKALSAYQESLKSAEKIHASDDIASAHLGIAFVYKQQGKLDLAVDSYLKAAAIYESLANNISLSDVYENIAAVYYQQENYELAADYYKKMQPLLDPSKKLKVATIAYNLGNCYYLSGDYVSALDAYQKSLKLNEEFGDKGGAATSHEAIGLTLTSQAIYDSALDHYQTSLSIFRSIKAQGATGVVRVMGDIGNLYRAENRNVEAIEQYRPALNIANEIGDKPAAATLLANTGLALTAQGNLISALDYHQKSLALFKELDDRKNIANSFANIGGIYFIRGNYPSALESFQTSLAILNSFQDNEGAATILRGLGLVLTAQGNYPEALDDYKKSLATFESLGKKGDIATDLVDIGIALALKGDYKQVLDYDLRSISVASEIGRYEILWHAQFRAGEAYRQLNQITQAKAAFESSIKTIEEMHHTITAGAESKSSTSKVGPYAAMAELSIMQKESVEAFSYSERTKAQALIDLLDQSGITIEKGMTADERDRERSIKADLISLNTQIEREIARKKPNQERLSALSDSRKQRARDYDQFEAKLIVNHPDLRVLRGDGKQIRPETAGRVIEPGSTIFDYLVTDTNTYLFVLARGQSGPVAPRLDAFILNINRKELAEKISRFKSQLESQNESFKTSAQDLYSILIKPAQGYLEGKESIVILPDDSLWSLPFQALQPSEEKFLIEDFDISYAPSLSVMDEMRKVRSVRNSSGVLSTMMVVNPSIADTTKERAELFYPNQKFLPQPETERRFKEAFQQTGSTFNKLYVQTEARENLFKAEAGKHRYIFINAPGIISDAAPFNSFVALAKSDKDVNDDGLLEAREIAQLNLKSELAVFTSMGSTSNSAGDGNGLVGLTWSLFVAGCPETMINQGSDETLIVNFYEKLRTQTRNTKPEPTSKLWRSTVLEFISKPENRQPRLWSGVSVIGAAR